MMRWFEDRDHALGMLLDAGVPYRVALEIVSYRELQGHFARQGSKPPCRAEPGGAGRPSAPSGPPTTPIRSTKP